MAELGAEPGVNFGEMIGAKPGGLSPAIASPLSPPPPLTGEQANPIDRAFGALRFHHAFNGALVLMLAALAIGAPQLTILPLYLALVARRPTLYLQQRLEVSYAAAVLTLAALAFAVLIATVLALFLPLILQARQIEAGDIAAAGPWLEDLSVWARDTLISLGVDPKALAGLDLAPGALIERLISSGDIQPLLKLVSGALFAPVLLVGLAFLVVFMAAYALGYATQLSADGRRLLRVCLPSRTVWIVERLVTHTQYFGAEVLKGYSWMVLVLGVFYFMVYLGALALFDVAKVLPPVIVVALVVLSGVIGAIPGLGAKLLLVVGAIAGVGVGAAAAAVTGSVWLGVYIFAAIVVVTGFESKFGTPSTLGRALGVNSALMLFIAIAAVAGYGVGATLWIVFVILPVMTSGMRVMLELYGDPAARAEVV